MNLQLAVGHGLNAGPGHGAPRRAEPAVQPDADALWGAVIRTYCTYKSQYVRDLRSGLTETNVRRVLEGQIDPFLEACLRAAAGAAGMPGDVED